VVLNRYWVRNYRSLFDVELQPGQLTVVVGANGTGKTNLYRALNLLSRGTRGELCRALLEEGGMPSVMFAGNAQRPSREKNHVVIGVTVGEVSYEVSLGMAGRGEGQFPLDPVVRAEVAWVGPRRNHRTVIADRAGDSALLTDVDGHKAAAANTFDPGELLLAQLSEPGRYPELFSLRAHLGRWRSYHEFPTGPDAPARGHQPGIRTPVLANDGRDLAAVVATINAIGEAGMLGDAVGAAFDGSSLDFDPGDGPGTFALVMHQKGMYRPVTAAEFSDGTLRFLYLAAALLTPRPPGLLVLNEPETGLHPPVLEPLSALVGHAARYAQVFVTTHSERLAELLAGQGVVVYELSRNFAGATEVMRL
jgi:predicted ATPase